MKTLLIGADGLLGSYWIKKITDLYPEEEIRGTSRRIIKTGKNFFLDLAKLTESDLESLIISFRPEIVVYLAGVTNVDDCERYKELALDMNANIPALIAQKCNQNQIKFIYISTDHLFGDDGSFFTEDEPVVLVNNYAKTKKLAEDMIVFNHPLALIIRTNFYGKSIASKPSFTDWIENNLKEKKEIRLGEDVYFNPVFMGDLVTVSHALLDKNQTGIFNVVSDDRLSKYEFGMLYAKFFGLNSQFIKPYKEREFPREVRRPCEMTLSNQKVKNITGMKLGKTSDGFERLKKELERRLLKKNL